MSKKRIKQGVAELKLAHVLLAAKDRGYPESAITILWLRGMREIDAIK